MRTYLAFQKSEKTPAVVTRILSRLVTKTRDGGRATEHWMRRWKNAVRHEHSMEQLPRKPPVLRAWAAQKSTLKIA
jgi:hypothetical protein